MLSAFCFWLSASLFFKIFRLNFAFFKDLQISENLTRYESKKEEVFHRKLPYQCQPKLTVKPTIFCTHPLLHSTFL